MAASGDEVSRPHGKGCRERNRTAVMCDDAGQQRLRTAEKQLAPAASATRAEEAQEHKASPARAELAQESRDEEMSEACVKNKAESVKPRIDESREDSTEDISRMEDGNTPVGGPLVSAEVNSRSEGVLPSRKRGSEKRGAPRDLTLECTDGSEMCISKMTVILMSLGVTTANSKVAELFCRNRFGDSAVGIGFERGIAADYATDGMNDNVGQQRLPATEQRVSSAGEQPSGATRDAAAQEGPDETMRQALAASSAKEASAASDADVVEKNQMGGGHDVIATMMRNANIVSEVKYKNFVEQCVKRPEEKGMYEIQRNEGRSFLHENLWNRWSRGLSFVKKTEGVGMRRTKNELCRYQSTMRSTRTGSCLKSKAEYLTEELGMCCCNKEKRTKIHVKNVMMMVLRGLSYAAIL